MNQNLLFIILVVLGVWIYNQPSQENILFDDNAISIHEVQELQLNVLFNEQCSCLMKHELNKIAHFVDFSPKLDIYNTVQQSEVQLFAHHERTVIMFVIT